MLRKCLITILFVVSCVSAMSAVPQQRHAVRSTPVETYDLQDICYHDVLAAPSLLTSSSPAMGMRVSGRNHIQNFSPRAYHADDSDRNVYLLFHGNDFRMLGSWRIPERAIDYYLFYLFRLRL